MTRLTNHRYGQVWGGAWFPDGRRIAYSHEDRLILLELGSGQSASYASPRKGRLVRTPAVSPDGRWIMFQVSRDGAWLLDLAAGSMDAAPTIRRRRSLRGRRTAVVSHSTAAGAASGACG